MPDQGFAGETTLGRRGVVAGGGLWRQAQRRRHRVAKCEAEALGLTMHIVGLRGDERIFGDAFGAEPCPIRKPSRATRSVVQEVFSDDMECPSLME